jgi:hypothetical protein
MYHDCGMPGTGEDETGIGIKVNLWFIQETNKYVL